jgi:hypothetical protein
MPSHKHAFSQISLAILARTIIAHAYGKSLDLLCEHVAPDAPIVV